MNSRALFLMLCCFCMKGLCATEAPIGPGSNHEPALRTKRRNYNPLYTNLLKELVTKNFEPAPDVVISLINNNADPHITTAFGRPLLNNAVFHKQFDVVQAALTHKADPNSRDALSDDTPLMLARSPEIAQYLIDHHADLHVRDTLGLCILTQKVITSDDGSAGVVAVLCNAGIYINRQNKYGQTPFYSLCSYGIIPAEFDLKAAILLFKGADYQLNDRWRTSPLQALKEECPERVATVEAVIAAASLVKQEKQDAYRKVLATSLSFLKRYLPANQRVDPVSLAIDYANCPPWDATCWPLFEKHMKKQRQS